MGVGGGGWDAGWPAATALDSGAVRYLCNAEEFFFSKLLINTWQTVYAILVLVCCEDSSKFEHIASQDICDPAPKMHAGRKEENNYLLNRMRDMCSNHKQFSGFQEI